MLAIKGDNFEEILYRRHFILRFQTNRSNLILYQKNMQIINVYTLISFPKQDLLNHVTKLKQKGTSGNQFC